jgi:hypothetical protein
VSYHSQTPRCPIWSLKLPMNLCEIHTPIVCTNKRMVQTEIKITLCISLINYPSPHFLVA